jgi:hypothetical protein
MKLTKSQLNQIIKEEFAKAALVSEEPEELNEIDFLGKDSQRALELAKESWKQDLIMVHNTLHTAVRDNSAHQAAVSLLRTIASKLDLMR